MPYGVISVSVGVGVSEMSQLRWEFLWQVILLFQG